MQVPSNAVLARTSFGEDEPFERKALDEAIVREARNRNSPAPPDCGRFLEVRASSTGAARL